MHHTSVELCSHIGGHAFAGNVIVYMPRKAVLNDEIASPLAGKGVWYGRVKTRHCEAILRETVLGGRIIGDLVRGVHPGVQIPM